MTHPRIKIDPAEDFQALQFEVLNYEYIIPETRVEFNYWGIEEVVDTLNSKVGKDEPKWFVCGQRYKSGREHSINSLFAHLKVLRSLNELGVMPAYFFERPVLNPFLTGGFSDWKKFTVKERGQRFILDRSLRGLYESVFFVRKRG